MITPFKTKTLSAGMMSLALAIWAVSTETHGETWKSPSQTGEAAEYSKTSSTALNWQSRVLKSSTTSQSARRAADATNIGEYRIARRSTGDYWPSDADLHAPYTGRRQATMVSDQRPEEIPPGTMQYEPLAGDGAFSSPGCGNVGCDCGNCGDGCECGTCCGECCDFGYECFDGRCGWWLRNMTVFLGGQGFKGPIDLGTNGNFGFHEGLGVSGPLGDPWNCGYQMGACFTQSDFSGTPGSVPGTDRTQYFVTAGIFRRTLCRGLQWGVVWDYMHDRYYDTFNLNQLRSDIGFVIDDCNEVGFLGTFGVSTDNYNYGNHTDIQLDPTDMFALYFRRNFENGGEGRIWGGATGRGDGLVGAELWVPLGRGFALRNAINYKIPEEGRANSEADADESWGLTLQLIWYPGKSALCQRCNIYRPLQNIADNTLFMVDRIAR